jgi:hypothetical protein
MPQSEIWVFFYGSYMNRAVLAEVGLTPGAVSDAFGEITYGFWLATVFAALLFAGTWWNWLVNPTRDLLDALDRTEYRRDAAQGGTAAAAS